MEERKELEDKLGYQFKKPSYLDQALTHKSFANENNLQNNERFEFMGDAVLQFVISEYLMIHYPDLTEGMMSKFRAVLVSEKGLNIIAKQIDLGKYIHIGKGEATTGGRGKKSILADTLEAVFASVYLDSQKEHGISKVKEMILRLFDEEFKKSEKTFSKTDFKTDLQELVQKQNLGEIQYRVIEEFGPDHDKEFVSTVFVDEKELGTGRGKSKKISEKAAAMIAIKTLNQT